ncbi:MAG: glycogen-binding domain-containing protein [Elusimicrobiota bacterium]
MTKKILLWAGFIIGIVIVAFPSLMLVERIRKVAVKKGKPKEPIKQEITQKPEPVKEKSNYPKITENGVVFQYKDDTAQKVFVAGTFNNWDGRQGIMTKNADGVWESILKVKPGRYNYKFKADGNWVIDPQNPVSADDGKGGRVSVLIVE